MGLSFLTTMFQAYVDPGSGSYVLQLLIGTMLGLLFVIKLSWNRIKLFLSSLFSGRKQDEQSDN